MENNNDIDELFREIIEPSEMNHSDKAWASLDNHLEKKSNKRDKAIIFRLRIAVGVLLFLFGSFAFYYFSSSTETNKGFSKELAQSESAKTTKPIKENYIPSKSNHYENNSSKKNSHSQNNISTKSEAALNQTKKQPRLVKTQKSNLNAVIKTNSALNFSVTNNGTINSNFSSKIILPTDIKNNSLELQSIDTTIKQSVNEFTITTTVKDSNKIVKQVEMINSIEKSNATATFSKEKFDSIQKIQFKNRLSVLAYFSPDFTVKYLKDNDKTDNENEGDYNSKEAPDFSYNTGILMGYDVSKNWSIKFGGTYAYLSQTIKPKTVYAKTGTDGLAHYQFNTTYGTSELPRDQSPAPVIGDSLNINSNSIQSLQIIGVPLISKYQITKNKFSYYAQLGVSLNFLIGEKLYVETPSKPTTMSKLDGLNEYYFGGIFGLGVSYNPTKKLSILFEPTVKGAITPINNNTPITTRPISFGLALGLGWHF